MGFFIEKRWCKCKHVVLLMQHSRRLFNKYQTVYHMVFKILASLSHEMIVDVFRSLDPWVPVALLTVEAAQKVEHAGVGAPAPVCERESLGSCTDESNALHVVAFQMAELRM